MLKILILYICNIPIDHKIFFYKHLLIILCAYLVLDSKNGENPASIPGTASIPNTVCIDGTASVPGTVGLPGTVRLPGTVGLPGRVVKYDGDCVPSHH